MGMYTSIVNELNQYAVLTSVEETLKVDRVTFLVLLAPILVLMAVFNVGPKPLLGGVAMLYPMVASLRAVKSESKEDDTQWLTYWVVLAALVLVESV